MALVIKKYNDYSRGSYDAHIKINNDLHLS